MPEEVYTFPMSFAQERLWFLDQLEPGKPIYNLPVALRLTGTLHVAALERSLNEIVRRHESLRTSFTVENGRTMQAIATDMALPMPVIDLQGLPEGDQSAEVHRRVLAESLHPFDLAKSPMLRACLLKLDGNKHVLISVMHHIISDGWSMGIFVRELAVLYRAFSDGTTATLPELPIQYADYAHWQREWFRGETLEIQLNYWKKQLSGAPQALEIPTDRKRPAVQTFAGGLFQFSLPRELATSLIYFSQERKVTLFMTLLAAFHLLLARYTGRQDVCVGIPIAGRNRAEIENLIGFFVNVLVIRTDLSGNPTVAELLERVKDVTLGAYDHQDLPFELLVEALHPERNLAYPPLVQVAFALQNAPMDALALPGLALERIKIESGFSRYDFTLLMEETSDGLQGIVEYNSGLFDAATIERMMAHYRNVLQAMVSCPQQGIDGISLTDEKELYGLLGVREGECDRILPMTAMQRDIYLETRINPDTLMNSLGFAGEISGGLDVERFRQALYHCSRLHGILRTRIAECRSPYTDAAYQCVPRKGDVSLELVDISPEGSPHTGLEARCRQIISRPYDLSRDPLVSHVLLKLDAHRHVWVLAFHHVVLDAIGATEYMREALSIYELLEKGDDVEKIPDVFPDYVRFNRERFDASRVIRFWREKSRDLEPLDFPAAPDAGKLVSLSKSLDESHWAEVVEYCGRSGIKPALYIKCLYGLLLKVYCRARGDFYIQEFAAGRPKGQTADPGCYYEQFPFIFSREAMRADGEVAELFSYARRFKKTLGENQHISIFRQRQLLPQGRLCFQYNFYNFPSVLKFSGRQMRIRHFVPTAERDVQLIAKLMDGTLQLNLHYHEGVFRDAGFLDRLVSLSRQIVGGAKRLSELRYVTESEARSQIFKGNSTAAPQVSSVQELFEAQAERTPDAVAVAFEDRQLTYRELNARANQLAHHLRTLGVGPQELVAICVERSLEMVVGVLGVVKSGATYIPMDAGYPRERLAYMMEDAGARVVLTQERLLGRILEHKGLTVCLDRDWHEIAGKPTGNPQNLTEPGHLFYVIYTSGSTGRPKGAGVTHRGEINLLQWYTSEFAIGERDRSLLVSAFGFDLTQKNLFATMIRGGMLVLPAMEYFEADVVRNAVRNRGITLLNCSPSAFYAVVEGCNDFSDLRTLRHVFLGGEPIHAARLAGWILSEDFRCEIVNTYGPTECTDIAAFYRLTEPLQFTGRTVPIGRPVDNARVYVLNEEGHIMPPGVAGELCIAGIGVGSGYIHDPQLTHEKFRPDPHGDGMMYRTGDLARSLPDGNLEYLGRLDFQVKIRGMRIEPGEVEHALRQQKGVKDCLAVARGERLIAYLIGEKKEIDQEGMSARLAGFVPDYMVPASYVALREWPLTPNGKIDRGALPEPQQKTFEYLAPRTDTERVICRQWSQLFGVERVGITQNFFELGGHSLLATQAISRIRQDFHVELPLRAIFEKPTVAGLADLVDAERLKETGHDVLQGILDEVAGLSDDEVKRQLRAG